MAERKEASVVSIATMITLLAMAVSGGTWVGAIANEVDGLKEDKAAVEETQKKVEDIDKTLTAVVTTQTFIMKKQSEQDKKLDKILEKLEELN